MDRKIEARIYMMPAETKNRIYDVFYKDIKQVSKHILITYDSDDVINSMKGSMYNELAKYIHEKRGDSYIEREPDICDSDDHLQQYKLEVLVMSLEELIDIIDSYVLGSDQQDIINKAMRERDLKRYSSNDNK